MLCGTDDDNVLSVRTAYTGNTVHLVFVCVYMCSVSVGIYFPSRRRICEKSLEVNLLSSRAHFFDTIRSINNLMHAPKIYISHKCERARALAKKTRLPVDFGDCRFHFVCARRRSIWRRYTYIWMCMQMICASRIIIYLTSLYLLTPETVPL